MSGVSCGRTSPEQRVITVRAAALCASAIACLSACAGPTRPLRSENSARSHAAVMECAPYAREVSGIQLYGDAADWWEAAAGRYGRSAEPSRGAVLVFRRSSRLPHGHVSVVAGLRSEREIAVTQANWVHGRIAHDEPVVDVSPGNDWTAVRVWWEPSGVLGNTVYPTYGFVTRGGPPDVSRRGAPDVSRRSAPDVMSRAAPGLEWPTAPGAAPPVQTTDARPATGASGVVCAASDTNGG